MLADCGNWIDPLVAREFGNVTPIADWSHPRDHVNDCGKALHGAGTPEAHAFAEPLKSLGWGEKGGFVEHLGLALNRPLDAITRNAGGPRTNREALAELVQRAEDDPLAGKVLVIWQFSTRELSTGGWLKIELGERKGLAPGPLPPPVAGAAVTVEARGMEVSPAPPVNAPYADALTYSLVELTTSREGLPAGTRLRCVCWVMRGRKLLPAAAYRPGELLRLHLQPYLERLKAEPDLEKIQVINTLDDLESAIYWVVESRRSGE